MEKTYNLEKDINSGAIEVYSPNRVNDKFENYQSLFDTSRLHGVNPLKGAKSMMSMYSLNYAGKDHYPEAQKRIDAWNEYIKHKIS